MILASESLLRDSDRFSTACSRVAREWPITAAVHISDRARNRRAFLGQTSCAIECGATETATRLAWWQLTPQEQSEANGVAMLAISRWEREHSHLVGFRNASEQLVFPFLMPPENGSLLLSISASASI